MTEGERPPNSTSLDFATLRREAGGTVYLAALWSSVPMFGGFYLLAKIAPVADDLHSRGDSGLWLYATLFAVLSGSGVLPTYAISALGGWVFGFERGAVGAMTGITCGAVVGFLISRLVSHQQVRALVDRHPQAAIVRRALLERSGFASLPILALLRIPPNMPFALSNLAMASAGAKFVPYALGALLGTAPRTLVAVYLAASAASTGAKDIQAFTKSGEGKTMLVAGIVIFFGVVWIIQRIGKSALDRALLKDAATRGPSEGTWWARSFDHSYLQRYAHRDEAEAKRMLATFATVVDFHRGPILDLCCGAGRHSSLLRQEGSRVFSLDYSIELLAAGRERDPALRLTRGDMRRLPYRDRAFLGVVHLFTAFGYFESDAENRGVLDEVARVVEPGGFYVLDLFNATLAIGSATEGGGKSERKLDDGSIVREQRSYDPIRKRVEKTMSSGTQTRFESVRVFEESELRGWFEAAGFVVERVLGDYEGGAYDVAGSPRMIIVARRR